MLRIALSLLLALQGAVIAGNARISGNSAMGGGASTVQYVNAAIPGTDDSGTNFSTFSTGAGLSVSTGNALVAYVRHGTTGCNGGSGTETFTDTALNIFTQVETSTFSSATSCVEVFCAPNITANASDVGTVDFQGSFDYISVKMQQWSGASHATPCPSFGNGAVSSTTSITSSTWTSTTSSQCVSAAASGNNIGITYTPGSGFTLETTDSNGQLGSEYKCGAGLTSASMGLSGSYDIGIVGVVISP